MLCVSGHAIADEIQVAVASNFSDTMKRIAERFEASSGHKVSLSFGSTGKHYAQIRNGAPFDAFFAADARRPELLEKEGVVQPGSRFTYAIGKLVLWSPDAGLVDTEGKVLELGEFRHLAIANPKLAPYGKAAQQFLESRGIWNSLQSRIVRGENAGQTYQFVTSGNAELGLVALSQVKRPGRAIAGSVWEVPRRLYHPIAQQAVLLSGSAAASDLLAFVKDDEALAIIRGYGYLTP
ncbi:MAG: molybdate ABC transporter substrate-binding protein [Pseudomonadota bacterium]